MVLNKMFFSLLHSVETKFRDIDAFNVAEINRASHVLQRRTLGFLSPSFAEASNRIKTRQPTKHTEKQPGKDNDNNLKIEISKNEPTRRIRRPTMIRRPKLIGKSTEGAAMQAMAASRKRASTNTFKKNKPSASPGIARARSNKDSISSQTNAYEKTESRFVQSQARVSRSVQEKKIDDTLIKVSNDFVSLCSTIPRKVERMSFVQSKARQALVDIWWPKSSSQAIPNSVADFLISFAPKAWDNVCAIPTLPGGISSTFIPTFARWIVAIKPDLKILSVSSSSNQTSKGTDSVMLCTEIRNIRGTKCCMVARISVLSNKSKQQHPLVHSEGWILNLRRRSKASTKSRRQVNIRTSYLTEKDSAGMDKILVDVNVSETVHVSLKIFNSSLTILSFLLVLLGKSAF